MRLGGPITWRSDIRGGSSIIRALLRWSTRVPPGKKEPTVLYAYESCIFDGFRGPQAKRTGLYVEANPKVVLARTQDDTKEHDDPGVSTGPRR
jgi:hypothetical protein